MRFGIFPNGFRHNKVAFDTTEVAPRLTPFY